MFMGRRWEKIKCAVTISQEHENIYLGGVGVGRLNFQFGS